MHSTCNSMHMAQLCTGSLVQTQTHVHCHVYVHVNTLTGTCTCMDVIHVALWCSTPRTNLTTIKPPEQPLFVAWQHKQLHVESVSCDYINTHVYTSVMGGGGRYICTGFVKTRVGFMCGSTCNIILRGTKGMDTLKHGHNVPRLSIMGARGHLI